MKSEKVIGKYIRGKRIGGFLVVYMLIYVYSEANLSWFVPEPTVSRTAHLSLI